MQDAAPKQHAAALPTSSDSWRLIPLLDAPGQIQMAIDTWLLDQHCRGLHPPTLRFYTWSPAAISLGYHQRQIPDLWKQLTWRSHPIELLNRPTGGRAVLHQGDLTYAVVTSGLQGTRLQIYQHLCEFLIRGWQKLGVALSYGAAGRGYIHNPNCFGTATGADLVLDNGSKLIGSAQVYRERTVLQHGSIRLATDAELFFQVFGEKLSPLAGLPTFIESLFSTTPDAGLTPILNSLIDAATECFEVELVPQPLSQAEWQAVMEFANKY
jgi:lipoate-protein ligase A